MNEETQRLLIVLAVGLFMVAAFWLGWNTAESRERRASAKLRAQYLDLQIQKKSITNWVRKNWPTQYEAYRHGHREGYQQGVTDAPELETMAEDSP